MSDINVLRKLFKKRGITFNSTLMSLLWSKSQTTYMYFTHWLNYFSRTEGVTKAIENMEICGVYCPLLASRVCVPVELLSPSH